MKGDPGFSPACSAAAGGHLEVLQWLKSIEGVTISGDVAVRASKGGHLHILEWLKIGGHPIDLYYCGEASKIGHRGILEWASRMDGVRRRILKD